MNKYFSTVVLLALMTLLACSSQQANEQTSKRDLIALVLDQ